ncbi:MAG: hypothetical protein CMD12_01125 [Flavobacteriales bacterium]|nr:hypothetical protein [Flavobacteriales bacterium]
MKKTIIVLFLYAIVFAGIFLYYKLNNKRLPFKSWGMDYKSDVKFSERFWLAFWMTTPVFFILFIL